MLNQTIKDIVERSGGKAIIIHVSPSGQLWNAEIADVPQSDASSVNWATALEPHAALDQLLAQFPTVEEPKSIVATLSDKVRAIMQSDGKLPAYAWPGGYQMFYLTSEGGTLCPDCANKHAEYSSMIVDYDANYEDPHLVCDDCGKHIDPSYMTEEEAAAARVEGITE